MSVKSKANTAQRYRIEIAGHVFLIAKGDGRHSRWYVLNEAGKYLTSGTHGKYTYEGALSDARRIASERDEVPA